LQHVEGSPCLKLCRLSELRQARWREACRPRSEILTASVLSRKVRAGGLFCSLYLAKRRWMAIDYLAQARANGAAAAIVALKVC